MYTGRYMDMNTGRYTDTYTGSYTDMNTGRYTDTYTEGELMCECELQHVLGQ